LGSMCAICCEQANALNDGKLDQLCEPAFSGCERSDR
jgi:hypothetical protein